jgi:hypothetical protein
LRGLVRVLPTFSERLRKGKVLPSLLEEVSHSSAIWNGAHILAIDERSISATVHPAKRV